jgi:hypothetical protein
MRLRGAANARTSRRNGIDAVDLDTGEGGPRSQEVHHSHRPSPDPQEQSMGGLLRRRTTTAAGYQAARQGKACGMTTIAAASSGKKPRSHPSARNAGAKSDFGLPLPLDTPPMEARSSAPPSNSPKAVVRGSTSPSGMASAASPSNPATWSTSGLSPVSL